MIKRSVPRIPLLATLTTLAALGCVEAGGFDLQGAIARAGAAGGLSDDSIISGLKEALQVGTRRAVSRTSSIDGFVNNPLIRIPLPESLETMATALRAIGFSRQVDELELGMNRAAEQATAEAVDVFWGAIRQMTFADARAIWRGEDTAATQLFERTTREDLRRRFEPIVREKMGQVGLARAYDNLVSRYTALPFTAKPPLDLHNYVTQSALDGLFSILGEEERKIRRDPAARTTDLLRTVFGS